MILLIYDDHTDILMPYGNLAQYDQIAGPLPFLYFSTLSNEHILFLYQLGV